MSSEGTSSAASATGEQLALLRTAARSSRARSAATRKAPSLAETDPVAVVLVDLGLAHLDRPFEYLVPAELADTCLPGVRVKVRFAGQDVDGFVVERRAEAEHRGRLVPVRRVVSAEPVLTPALLRLCRAVARRYAGTLSDVLRLAVPPRHATAERNLPTEPGADAAGPVGAGLTGSAGEADAAGETDPAREADVLPWQRYPAGPAFLRRVAAGERPAASWLAAPTGEVDRDWPAALASLAAATLAAGRGVLVVLPDRRDVVRVDSALTERLGKGGHVRLTADQGPQARYTAWLKVLRGHVRCVVGTRAAAFAPVRDLGLVAWWDDGDDLHAEPRAPYPHVREVLELRAELEGCALVVGGFSRSVAVQQWLEEGRLRAVQLDGPTLRRTAARIRVAGEGREQERDPAAAARLPSLAWRTAKQALTRGPVLVQVPRRGYLPALSCQTCRQRAHCPTCHGPLALPGPDAPPQCRWCGTVVRQFVCPECEGRTLRSTAVGARRTAEELGRAFPGVPVHTSGGGQVLDTVDGEPALVIATPGAEPVAPGGYAAALLLDAWALLDRPALDAGEEAVRRWTAAGALVRPADEGGAVVLCGVPQHTTLPPVEALVRWDPAWFAARELAERRDLALPPAVWMAQLTGPRAALRDALAQVELPADVEQLGPMPVAGSGPQARRGTGRDDGQQVLLRAPLPMATEVADALAAMRAVRSAHKTAEVVGVRIDPQGAIG
ncbi:MAG TPA: primosomal protein N' [Segeticoccus sp.]|uniref:primosomal protein N' n=1 Tax=Segeticoccus sp. TaxID=2706531 RepID=UPI002D7E3D50|nr:primosomal protein N' [Segeticoccus sp.]HET8600635.1 primosomal protein N' [Segeticoccus sp.]